MTPASSGHERFLETRTFSSLDGLRAISIIAVVWHHAGSTTASPLLLQRGFLGVDLFFLISGFLITTLLLRERRRTGDISLFEFYRRRCLRIVPAYWVMLTAFSAIAFLRPPNTELRHELPYAALYLSNLVVMASPIAITWSLSAEEQFYLIVPALQKFASRAFVWMLPLLYVAAILPTFGAWPSLPSFFKETTFGPILLGVMLAYVMNSVRGWQAVERLLGRPFAPIVATLLIVVACSYPGPDISGWPRICIHFALLALLASCVVREGHLLEPILTWTPLRRLGTVSYGVYLYHKLALAVMLRAVLSGGALFGGVSLLSWIMAEISFRTLEARFLALKYPAARRLQSLRQSMEAGG